MEKFVVVNSHESVVDEHAADYGGEVLASPRAREADMVWAVVQFADNEDGPGDERAAGYSRRVNGTVFDTAWAAKYHLRSRSTSG
jgi:hypothetical protein